jgi:pimeloyl-ACP methyl ester carboxylesterase
MEIIRQNKFARPLDRALLDKLDDEPLVVHQKPEGNKALIVFVHGLGGCRYGEESTWGRFPEFLYEDFPQFEVGLYEFHTLVRRAKFWKSVSLSYEAEVFAGIIRDIKDYQTIILIGHSMGGLLCMAAICHLINTSQKKVLSRIGGLILMATPQAGSQRVPTLLSWFSEDFYALKPHGDFVTSLHDTLVNHQIVLDESHAQSGDIVISTWAVLGASDRWVDKLSAGLHLPESRKKMVRGSHTEIVKPQSKQSDAYPFVHDRVQEVWAQGKSARLNFDIQLRAHQVAPGHIGAVELRIQLRGGSEVEVRGIEFRTLRHWDIPDLSSKGTTRSLFNVVPETILRRHVLIKPDEERVAFFSNVVRVNQQGTVISAYVLTEYAPTDLLGGCSAIGLFPFLLNVTLVLANNERIECGKVMLSLNADVEGSTTASRYTVQEYMHVKHVANDALAHLDEDTAVDEEVRSILTNYA